MTRDEIAAFAAAANAERRDAFGEALTLAGVDVLAILSGQSGTQSLDTGGFRGDAEMRASILLTDMPTPPQIGASASARGIAWRVVTVGRSQYSHEITLAAASR